VQDKKNHVRFTSKFMLYSLCQLPYGNGGIKLGWEEHSQIKGTNTEQVLCKGYSFLLYIKIVVEY
jgi:hypothetical protein